MNLFNKIRDYLDKEPDYYGFATIIKEYAGFPQWIPLPAHYEHGWTDYPNPGKTDLETNKNLMLVFSKRREEAWKRHSSVPVAVTGAPFVLYRRMNDIKKDENAKGSVAFPAHSTSLIEVNNDIDNFCKQLKQLNSNYHPITICLHGEDLKRSLDINFIEKGYKVVSAGDENDKNFYQNFYDILKKHNYSVSNSIGSHTFYSIEMEIPFLYLEVEHKHINRGDPNLEDPNNMPEKRIHVLNFLKILLSSEEGIITNEQKELVISELGIDDCTPPKRLKMRLWKAFLFKEFYYYLSEIGFYLLKIIHDRSRQQINSIKDSFYMIINNITFPNKIFTHLTTTEKVLLHKTAKSLKTNSVCVEIGSYLGASSCFIAGAISPDSKLICIDTWGNNAMKYDNSDIDVEERDTYREFIINTRKYSNKIIKIRKWSYDAIEDIKKITNSIDFLFIDGDHNYDGVKRDWELFSKLLRKEAVVAFHDTGWAKGVQRVIREDVLEVSSKIADLPNMQVYIINSDL